MKAIKIGRNARGEDIEITPEMRQSTHTHVVGGSGKGKSKFLEWLIRQDIRAGHGLCLIDWHGLLYKDVLRYCAQLDIGIDQDFRKLILINPSQPHFITGFNPFVNQGDDISVQIRNRINATIRPWGITDTNLMPTFENVMYAIYSFAVEMGETLPNAARLLEFERRELRQWATSAVSEREGKRQLQRLVDARTFKEWREIALSSENRIGRFLGSKSVRRFMGLKDGNLNLLEAMDEGQIILVNLGSSGFLDRESARVFASLFLNEFFETAMKRVNDTPYGIKPRILSLYLDEFQEYITDDIGAMLDQVRKGGLHMVLAHQHFGHLLENKKLLKSILTNARIRAVLGGLDFEDATLIANEMFLPDLNTRQIKKAYYHTTHYYEEQERLVQSFNQGTGTNVGSNWSSGLSEAEMEGESYGESYGRTRGKGHSHSSGVGQNIGSSNITSLTMSGNNVESWFGEPEILAETTATGIADSDSYSETDTDSYSESESYAESHTTTKSKSFARSQSIGGSLGSSKNESKGVSIVPVWVPIPVKELTSETEWSREEKVSKVAEMLKNQLQRHCFIKLDAEKTQPLLIPFVKNYPISEDNMLEYEQEVYKEQSALSSEVVDKILDESDRKFLKLASGLSGKETINITPKTINPDKSQDNFTPKVVDVNKTSPTKREKTFKERIKDANPDIDI